MPEEGELRSPMPEEGGLRSPMPEEGELRSHMPEEGELRSPMPEEGELVQCPLPNIVCVSGCPLLIVLSVFSSIHL
jgi:hypothetical protein